MQLSIPLCWLSFCVVALSFPPVLPACRQRPVSPATTAAWARACMHARCSTRQACLVRAAGLRGFDGGEREEEGALRGELRSLSLPESLLFLLRPLDHR